MERCFVHVDYQFRDVSTTEPPPPCPPPSGDQTRRATKLTVTAGSQVDDHDPKTPIGYKTFEQRSLPPLSSTDAQANPNEKPPPKVTDGDKPQKRVTVV